jgi:hypothetical protein
MKTMWLAGCCLFLASALCYGADVGVITILDGNARLLRGVSWHKLIEGARLQDGDVIDTADRAQVQIEMSAGPMVNFVGPAELLVAGAGSRESKQPAPAEMYLTRGWLKLAAKQGGIVLRVRSPAGTITTGDGVVVMHVESEALEAFVERGNTRLNEPGRGAAEATAHDVKSGEFAISASDRPFGTSGAAPQKFVAAMPRHFRDPLPNRAALYEVSRVQLVADRTISYAEAEPWLTGPYRRAFLKRLQPRLTDPEFRAPVMAKLQAYPEWHGALVPPEAPPKDKAEAPPKAAEKAEKTGSTFTWPFGNPKK